MLFILMSNRQWLTIVSGKEDHLASRALGHPYMSLLVVIHFRTLPAGQVRVMIPYRAFNLSALGPLYKSLFVE